MKRPQDHEPRTGGDAPHPLPPHKGEGGAHGSPCSGLSAGAPGADRASPPPRGEGMGEGQEKPEGQGRVAGLPHAAGYSARPARQLRRDMTPGEQRVWAALRQISRVTSLHFRRKAPVGPCIADFAQFSRRIVVLIGDRRDAGAQAGCDAWLKAQGFAVLRFDAREATDRVEAVIGRIMDACDHAASMKRGRRG